MIEQLRRGVLLTIPVALSAAVYGSVLGFLAAGKGIGWLPLMAMNVSIFAGTAQYLIVDMWGPRLPVIEIALAVLIINFRYFLIGASLRPLFAGQPLRRKMAVIHLVADENWALTMAEYRKGKADIWFLFGGGLCLVVFWSAATLLGLRVGQFIGDPEKYALDFVVIAVFTALAASLFRGKRDILPYLLAALAAVLARDLIPGRWYIVIGAVAGSLGAALLPERMKDGIKL